MDSFEFSEQDNKTFSGLSSVFKRVGIAWVVLGTFSIIHYFVLNSASDDGVADVIGVFAFAAINIGFGVIIFRPADNLQRIADTEGRDIEEMMTVVDELSSGFKIVNIIFAVGIIAFVLASIFIG